MDAEADWDKHFILTADIDLNDVAITPIGTDTSTRDASFQGTLFTGVFDGNDHIIRNAEITGDCSIGVLVGRNSGTINNCFATGSVHGTTDYVGGLVGQNYHGTVTACYSIASIRGEEDFVGGLVGQNSGGIRRCHSSGSVRGFGCVGGLVGYNYYYITNSYAIGCVTGRDRVGGLAGVNSGSIKNAYFLHPDDGGGPDNGNGEALSDIQMRQQGSFVGWDFVGESVNGTEDIWSICEGTNYPRLVWQIPSADWVCPDGVGFEDFGHFGGYWGTAEDGPVDLDGEDGIGFGDLMVFCEEWLRGR